MADEKNQHSLEGLLRFAISHTEHNDITNSTIKTDLMRKEFLENALKTMISDTSGIKEVINILSSASSTQEDIINALNYVRDYIESIDCANHFIKIGGLPIITDCLQIINPKIKTCALYIIAELSENNPFAQQEFLNAGVITVLLPYINDNENVASSALHAISAMTRNFEPGCAAFIKVGGIKCLISCLQSHNLKVFVKSCFLIRILSMEHSTVRDQFVHLSAIETLGNYIEVVPGFDLRVESVLSALCALSETDDGRSHLSKTKATETICGLIKLNKGKPECEDIIKYAYVLLQRLEYDSSAAQ